MKKKFFTFLLTATLATSMIGVATVSASAALDEEGRYYPTTDETYRYYFYMPQDWENELSTDASVYWWGDSDIDDFFNDRMSWPGVKMQKGDVENVFYVDCPIDATQIILNNSIDSGLDHEAPQYRLAKQTDNIGVEYYDPGESQTYPDGLENFDNMIYVLDPNKVSITPTSNKEAYNGEWYYYYGSGEYGVYPNKADAVANNDVRNTEYYPPRENLTQPTTIPPTEEVTTVPVTEADTTVKPSQPSTNPTSGTTPVNGSSADSANGGTNNNGAVKTGASSMSVALLAILSSVTGIVVLTRKKFN